MRSLSRRAVLAIPARHRGRRESHGPIIAAKDVTHRQIHPGAVTRARHCDDLVKTRASRQQEPQACESPASHLRPTDPRCGGSRRETEDADSGSYVH